MDNQNKPQGASGPIYRISLNVLHALFIRTNGWWANKVSDPLKVTPLKPNTSGHDLWVNRTTSDTKIEHARRQY